MRVSFSLAEAEALANRLYAGDSKPLSVPKPGDRHLDETWWREPRKVEAFSSDRHLAALRLYLQLAQSSLMPLGEYSFPSSFDFPGGKARNPDKGFVKMCLNAEPAILTARMVQGHLVFDVTDQGRALLETA